MLKQISFSYLALFICGSAFAAELPNYFVRYECGKTVSPGGDVNSDQLSIISFPDDESGGNAYYVMRAAAKLTEVDMIINTPNPPGAGPNVSTMEGGPYRVTITNDKSALIQNKMYAESTSCQVKRSN